AHALCDSECAGKNLFEQTPDGTFILGGSVGAFELSQYLRLADNHGIEAGGNTKQMLNRIFRLPAIEMSFKGFLRTLPPVQKSSNDESGLLVIGNRQRDLNPVACGEDNRF